MKLTDSVSLVKNIGEKRLLSLNKQGVYTVKDLIEYYPRTYKDRSNITDINLIDDEEFYCIRGRITDKPDIIRKGVYTIVKAKIRDNTGYIEAVWFNRGYLKNTFKTGCEYIFMGKTSYYLNKLTMQNPEYEQVTEKELLSSGRIVPVYVLKDINQKIFRNIIKQVLDEITAEIEDFMPDEILHRHNLPSLDFAIKNIHFPQDGDSFYLARKRLVFDELFIMQSFLFRTKRMVQREKSTITINDYSYNEILEKLPFTLTEDQIKVIDEITEDLKKGNVLNRLIQGDVGSGKTVVALVLGYLLIKNGYQCSLMAPTDVLATQHYKSLNKILEDLGYKTVLLTGSLKASEKKQVYNDIKTGKANLIIGTHALIQKGVEYYNLGICITDEQHRFGVRQREKLIEKGNNPHVVVMTATPIPRTLALVLYADLDVSVIRSMPPGRQKIDTTFVDSTFYNKVYSFVNKEIQKGHQAYIICPLVEKNEKSQLKAVDDYTESLRQIFKGLNISGIYGKMKNEDKEKIMDNFAKGEIHILVSTTVIEVGINVPNATVMLIENAERFGLSQLHQLRGRVGRGQDKSYCILVSDTKSKTGKERLNVMLKTTDGFKISQEDLRLRGQGDFFGTRQHGLPDFKIANLYEDMDILKSIQDEVTDFFENKKDYPKLKEKIMEFGEKNKLLL